MTVSELIVQLKAYEEEGKGDYRIVTYDPEFDVDQNVIGSYGLDEEKTVHIN